MDQSDQITSGIFFCQKSRDPDQENTFQKSGPELYIIAENWKRRKIIKSKKIFVESSYNETDKDFTEALQI